MQGTKYIAAPVLQRFVKTLFERAGMPEADAERYAKLLLFANLRGIDSHGVLRAGNYFDRMRCGAINPKPDIRVKQLAPAVHLVDGDDAAGCIAGTRAMELAIESAGAYGVGIAGVLNSNHFGAAAFYSQMAVEKGYIGLAMTNVPTLIAAPGGKARLVGNNPFALGIPTYCAFPFMLDMSMSVVAEGKLRVAAAKGESIPQGWAADRQGNPTTDPQAALDGFLLPVGGYKGLGMAYAVDILSGLITGGVFADRIGSMYRNPDRPSKVGHFMAAINLSAFVTPEEMRARMQAYHDHITAAPRAEGVMPLCFPGEPEYRCMQQRLQEGIPVPAATLLILQRLAQEQEIDFVV